MEMAEGVACTDTAGFEMTRVGVLLSDNWTDYKNRSIALRSPNFTYLGKLLGQVRAKAL